MSDKQEASPFARVMLIGILIWFASWWFSGSKKPQPVPPPVPAAVSEVETANSEATQALTRHIRDVIDELQSGQLTDERKTRDLLAAGVKAANEAAWGPVKARDVTAFSDGWTPAKQIARLKAMIGE